ncbi:histidinol-phosphate aminotransferase [Scopulibacillus daqui]|uniref:Histidinol-phosphate aminotransferase n=1 Tax=Scopulibacillus daqui TaxID=1469162 RepID=A0ABS2PYL3_9BACL|nr:histidinol-phosphate transaminase [Scopulibacillus daqui]MBM7645134.1 histidinol-phosphate aminotransferase [Scopulibacillus daqui]
MLVKNQILSLQAYQPGKSVEEIKKDYGLAKIVKLNSNENPYGCSPKAAEALARSSSQCAVYPDGQAMNLRTKAASHLGVNEDQIIFGAGLDEVIQIISRALLTPESNVVMASPTFSQYKLHAVIEGAEIRETATVNGHHDLESMLSQIDSQTRIVWICNPNNPTGTYINETSLKDFISRVPKETLVVIDEAYYEYVTAEDFPHSVKLLENNENVMVLRTFSKAYGLAGLRVGYGIGSSSFIQKLEVTRLPFNTSRTAQIAAEAALEDQNFIKECVKINEKGLKALEAFCEEHQINYYPSQANFIFLKTDNGAKLYELLLQKGYIARLFPDGLRITIGTEEENEQLLSDFKDIVAHAHTAN